MVLITLFIKRTTYEYNNMDRTNNWDLNFVVFGEQRITLNNATKTIKLG